MVAFVLSMLVSAGTAEACHGSFVIQKVETGQLAPDDTYVVRVSDDAGAVVTDVSVTAGESVTVPRVKRGTYFFEELDAPPGAQVVPTSATIDTDGQVVEVVVTNPYPGGRFTIEKIETGNAAPGGTYDFSIRGPVDFDATIAAGSTWDSGWVPLGTYTIEEIDAPAGATVVPDTVTLTGDGEQVAVVATNPFHRGAFEVTKVETGSAAPGGTYTFDVTGPESFEFTVVAGETWTSGALPLGEYTLTERDAPAGHTIEPNPVVLDEEVEFVSVTATNPFRDLRARLTIEKVVTGPEMPGHDFTIDVSGPVDFTVTLSAGERWTSEWLPLGTYTVTEVDPWEGHTIVPNPVVLDDDGEDMLVTVTNPWPAGKIAIEKVETGGTAPGGTYTFEVDGPESFTVDVAAGDTWTSDWLELGTYTITEVDAPAGHTITPNPVVLDEDEETVLVTAVNPYRDEHARLAIEKVVTGPDMPGHTFTMNVTGPLDFSVDVEAGDTWTSGWLPLGTYTVTEVDPFDGHTIVPNPVVL
ncbi:MAG: hypothetical protein AAFP84_13625, partial [Actinomycetota bacterium]